MNFTYVIHFTLTDRDDAEIQFRKKLQQVAQLSQRDRATHELLRFAKLRSEIFKPPFGGLRGKVGALSISRWKAHDRLRISDK